MGDIVSDIQQIRADLGIPAEHKSSPLKNWYIDHFKKYLPTIRSSELLTTYFAASYGELYEYGSDFSKRLTWAIWSRERDMPMMV